MNGRQELLRVVSLFDMTKVDLPSFNISIAKFDELGHAYSKILLLSSVIALNDKREGADVQERREIAIKTINALIKNPDAYSYDEVSRSEREIVNQAANDIWGYRPPSKTIANVKQKAKNNLMVKNIKQIVSFLQEAEKTYPDFLLDKYMDDSNFYGIIEQLRNGEKDAGEQTTEASTRQYAEEASDTEVMEEHVENENATDEAVDCNTIETFTAFHGKKKSFWSSLFAIIKK